MNNCGRSNVAHYVSSSFHMVSRSVKEAEVSGLFSTLNSTYILPESFKKLSGRKLLLESFMNSSKFYRVFAMKGNTAGRRLQIYVCALKKRYCRGFMKRIVRIYRDEKKALNSFSNRLKLQNGTTWKWMMILENNLMLEMK